MTKTKKFLYETKAYLVYMEVGEYLFKEPVFITLIILGVVMP